MSSSVLPIRVLVVDDHPVLRDGLVAMIEGQSDMTLVASVGTGADAIDAYRRHRPDVTLMDLRLPDMHGIAAIEVIRADFPGARIIVLTMHVGDMQATRALKAGARGYLTKSTIRFELLDAIRTVHAGGQHVLSESTALEIQEHAGEGLLTQREIQVLEQVAAGRSNKVIADVLSISEETVKTHIRSVLAKLGANDRTHAVTLALRRGFLEL